MIDSPEWHELHLSKWMICVRWRDVFGEELAEFEW
jgi:hypothetical protein